MSDPAATGDGAPTSEVVRGTPATSGTARGRPDDARFGARGHEREAVARHHCDWSQVTRRNRLTRSKRPGRDEYVLPTLQVQRRRARQPRLVEPRACGPFHSAAAPLAASVLVLGPAPCLPLRFRCVPAALPLSPKEGRRRREGAAPRSGPKRSQ